MRQAAPLACAALLLAACGGAADPGVPLAPDSPWPKFRANARQDGRSDVHPTLAGGALWTFPTGKLDGPPIRSRLYASVISNSLF